MEEIEMLKREIEMLKREIEMLKREIAENKINTEKKIKSAENFAMLWGD